MRGGKLTERIWPYKDLIFDMYDSYSIDENPSTSGRISQHTAFHYSRNNGPNKRHGERIVDMKFERRLGVVVAMMRQYIEERSYQIEAFSGHVRYLEYGTYSLADKLRGGGYRVLATLNEYRNFPCSWRFQYPC